MPDRIFYPIAFLFIAAMVGLAIFWDVIRTGPAVAVDPISEGFVLEGEGLRALIAQTGTSIDILGEVPAFATASAHIIRDDAPPSAGIFGYLNPAFETAFGGKTINFTVRARASSQTPSQTFSMGYYTDDVGASPRQEFALTSEFKDYTVTYKPARPLAQRDNPGDFAGIWPDVTGQNGKMDIERLSVKIAP